MTDLRRAIRLLSEADDATITAVLGILENPGTVPALPTFDYDAWLADKRASTPVSNKTVEAFLENLPSHFVWGHDAVAREVYSARYVEVMGGDLRGDHMEVELFKNKKTRIVDPDVAVLYYDPSKVQPTAKQAEDNLNIWFARQLGIAQDGVDDWNQTYGKRGSSGITESKSGPAVPPPPPPPKEPEKPDPRPDPE